MQALDGAADLVGVEPRLDPDRGQLDRLGAERVEATGELARLRPGAGDDDPLAVQRPALEPGDPLAASRDRADDGHRGRLDLRLLGAPAMPSSVELTVRWPGSVPRSTTAAGSDGSRPAAISASAIRGRALTPM